MSRISDAGARKDLELGDEWVKGAVFYEEHLAQQEFAWLKQHSNIREYMLVARCASKLNDPLPF